MTYRYAVDFHEVYGIFTPGLPLNGVMKGSDTDNQDAADFILAGATDYVRCAFNTFRIHMRRVLVTYRNDTGGLLAQSIAKIRREGVGNNNGLISLNSEARMSQPVYIHDINLSQAALGVKKCLILWLLLLTNSPLKC